MIHLEANFVQFKEELLPKEGNKALLTFPFLHIYWTDCCVSVAHCKSTEIRLVRCVSFVHGHSKMLYLFDMRVARSKHLSLIKKLYLEAG